MALEPFQSSLRLLDWRVIVSVAADVTRHENKVILGTGARSFRRFGLRSVDDRRSLLNRDRHCPRRCRQLDRHRTRTRTLSGSREKRMAEELVEVHAIRRLAPQQAH